MFIYYINTNELPSHFILIVFLCERHDLLCSHSCNSDIFTCEDNDYVLFSHVKADIKFPGKRSPGILLVFI